MTEQRDVPGEYMAVMAGQRPATPPPPAEPPAGAPSGAVAPWGTMHTDPAEQLSALSADPNFQAALFDGSHPGHSAALAARSRLFAQIHGDEPVAPQGAGWGGVADEGYSEPTEQEMQRAYAATAQAAIERAGLDAETAQGVAEIAVTAGLSTLEISDISQAVSGSQHYSAPEAAIASLGDNSAEIIRAAQQEAHALGLPQELLDMPVGENLVLGEHPALIVALARRRGVR